MALQRQSSAGYMTNMAARLMVRALGKRLTPLGMSPAYMPVLLALEHGPLTQKEIADGVGVEQPTMTATLNRMARDGWIERLPNPDDGRSALVSLSEKAREHLPGVDAAVDAVNEAALGGLSATERAHYFELLARVIARLEEDVRRG
ncbi:MAG: MarR family transcriptional regulator [Phyllobacteriaceae bacterium]|nr:MarR family transcriptional regulator [Phyllobacteriaceae bacterium]